MTVQKEIWDEKLEMAMRKVSLLRRSGKEWLDEWDKIAMDVYDKNQKMISLLKNIIPINKAYIIDGKIREVFISAENFVKYNKLLFHHVPCLEYLELTEFSKTGGAWIFNNPFLNIISALTLKGGVEDFDIKDMVFNGFANRTNSLHYLDISHNNISDLSLEYLARSQYLENLCFVNWYGNRNINKKYLDFIEDENYFETQLTDDGKSLELLSPRKYLPWLHAQQIFGSLYPPRKADAKPMYYNFLCHQNKLD